MWKGEKAKEKEGGMMMMRGEKIEDTL